jgi:acyl-CoA reductase-like NAD-dependent aldehyde dehydrogenase
MDIVEKLRLVDCTFWYKPLGHGIDTDLDVPAYELGALSHEAADEIERLREALADLVAVQNGPPLVTYTEAWDAAMEKAYAALKEGE